MDVEDVFRSHHESLFRYLARQCGDEHVAQDAVQETFLRLHRQRSIDAGAVRSWLFVTGMNVMRDHMRTAANRRRLVEAHPGRLPEPSSPERPDERVERLNDLERLRAALDGLRDKERAALLMREEGFKHREIADALGTTTASIGTLIARALEKLTDAMHSGEGGA